MLISNWLGALVSRIRFRPRINSRARRAIRKRWQTVQENRLTTIDQLEERTMLTAQIIDNGDAGYSTTGSWAYYNLFTSPLLLNAYESDENYISSGGSGGRTAKWEFTNLAAGTYQVSSSWYDSSLRASNVLHTISGLGDVYVDQRSIATDFTENGADWENLGLVTVAENGTISITLSDSGANGAIVADAMRIEKVPELSINDVIVDENAGIATFTVTLNQSITNGLTVDYATAGNTATSGSDFTAKSGTLNFAGTAGETQTISIALNDDNTVELDETFFVNLSNVQAGGIGATIADAQGIATVVNEDSTVMSLESTNVTRAEGNSGTTEFSFVVNLSNPLDVDFHFWSRAYDGTATEADGDFTDPHIGYWATIAAGATSATVYYSVNGDTKVEEDETFSYAFPKSSISSQLSPLTSLSNDYLTNISFAGGGDTLWATGTINDDDSASLSINDVTVDEDAGTATLTVTLNNNVDTGFTVDYSTQNNTATSGADYTLAAGQLTFAGTAGETHTITVNISDNTTVEALESLYVNLSNLVVSGNRDVTIADSQGEVSITDNDSATLSIGDLTVDEGAGTATFTVTLDHAVQNGVNVDWSTADGTATAGTDYTAGSGTLNFTGTAGETQTITVTLTEDLVVESDETFVVNMSNLVAGGNVTLTQATATITDNDSITIDGTAADDDFLLQLNADGVTLEVWNDVSLIYSDLLANITEININGDAGVDTLTIDLSNDLPFPIGNINFDGEADGGSITLDSGSYAGSLTTVTHTLSSNSAGSISIDGQIINYTSAETLTDNLVVTNRAFNFVGAAETITLSDSGTSSDGLSSIDSTLGAAVTFSSTASAVSVSTSSGNGTDSINVQGLDSLNAGNLTITGDADDDVNFQTSSTAMLANDLNVTAQTITVDSGISSTTGAISLTASRNIVLNSGSSLTTVDGGITLVANTGGTTTGDFRGIEVASATIESTGSGNISLTGQGGDGTLSDNYGVLINNSSISSTVTGASAATITIDGIGGTGTSNNNGVIVANSNVTSADGDILLTGQGGDATLTSNYGVSIDNSSIASTGTGTYAATITLDGTSGTGTANNKGVYFTNNSSVTSVDGDISVTGRGHTNVSGESDIGVALNGSEISSTGTGANAALITIDGTGGVGTSSNIGIFLANAASVTSAYGNILLTGQGGVGTLTSNYGVLMDNSTVSSTGMGINAATININGTGGTGTSNNYGVYLTNNASVTSTDGALSLMGQGGNASDASNFGIYLRTNSSITSLGTGANAATITLNGTGGAGASSNRGLVINDADISSLDGNVSLIGQGSNGTGAENHGVNLIDAMISVGDADFSINGQSGDSSGGSTNIGAHLVNSQIDSTGTGMITITGTGGDGTGNNRGINLTNTDIDSYYSNVLLTGQGGNGSGANNFGVYLQSSSSISSLGTGTNAATITLDGTGGTGTGSGRGVVINSNVNISSADGNISLIGQGGNTTGTENYGVNILSSTVSSTGLAMISVNGTAGTGTNNNHGVYTNNANLTSVTGNVSITGQGGDGTGASNMGVFVDNGSLISSTGTGSNAASITLDGSGGTSTNWGYGVYIDDSTTKVTSVDGDISITGSGRRNESGEGYVGVLLNGSEVISTGLGVDAATITIDGTGGTGTVNNHGIFLANTAAVTSTDGAISLTGEGGNGTVTGNYGVDIGNNSTVTSLGTGINAATITIDGTGGSGTSSNFGINLNNASVTSTDGNILVTGQGGAGTETGNYGVNATSSLITSTGTGPTAATVTIDGTGGTGTSNNHGVYNISADITSVIGNISITGQGGDGTGSNNVSVYMDFGNISSTGTGLDAATITIDGTGGAGTDSNRGIFVYQADITSIDGDILLTATGGGGNTSFENQNHGVNLHEANVTSTGTGVNAAKITIDGTGGTGFGSNVSTYLYFSDITSAAGDIAISGSGATTTGEYNYGVILHGGTIASTATGTNAAAITIDGTGGTGTNLNHGVFVTTDGEITTKDGNISISGNGNGNGIANMGFINDGTISSTGIGTNAGKITIDGTGAAGTHDNRGILIPNSLITSIDGDISLTGQGGNGSGLANIGILIDNGSVVSSTGTGTDAATITIDGTAGTSSTFGIGVKIDKGTTIVTSVDGDISVTGQGSSGSGGIHLGANLSDAQISSTGTGADAATITVYGTGGTGGSGNDGIAFTGVSGDADVTSVAGDIFITSADNAVFSNSMSINSTSGNITVVADDAAGNNGKIISMHDGTLFNAGSGTIDLDTDGDIFLAGLATSGHVAIDTTSGSIYDNGDIHLEVEAATASFNAAGWVGTSANPLETNIGSYTVSSGLNDININNRELFSINDITANEDGSFVFTVSLSRATDQNVTVLASTSTGTAGAGDFTAISNQMVTITAGQTSATVTVNVTNDSLGEDNETFNIVLSDPKFNGATDLSRVDIGDGTGTATIIDDDNHAPVASDESIAASEDGTTVTTSVLASDVDNEDDANSLTYIITSQPSEGSASSNGNGTFTFDPESHFQDLAAGETRQVTFTFTATDSHNQISNIGTVTVTVTGVNDLPTLDTITDPAAIDEDAGQQTINLTGITAGGGESQTLTVTAISNNPTLIANPVVTYTSGDPTGTLTYTPEPNQSGTATITITVTDSQLGEITRTFNIVVNSINDLPTLDVISDPTAIDEDASQQTINLAGITAGGGESQTLTITATSDNPTLIANPVVTYTSGDPTGILTYTPEPNQSGTATITVTVTDDQLGEITRTFTVVINPVNDLPTLDVISDPTAIDEDASQQTINLTGITAGGGESQTLTITATSDNPTLIANPIVTYTSGDPTGTLSYTPEPNQSGTATITVTVTDEQLGEITRTFTVVVNPVNDAPTVGNLPNINTTENSSIGGSFLGDDVDTDDDINSLVYAITSQPAEGTVVDNGDGTFTFDPGSDFDDLAAGESRAVNFTYTATDSHGAVSNTGTVTVTITGSNATLSIDDVTVNEMDGTATFTVTLDKAVVNSVDVDYATADSTAQSGTDYTALSGTLTFDGTVPETKTITIAIADDNIVEIDEQFFINLSNVQSLAGHVDIADPQGIGTINASDSAILNIGDLTVAEDGVFTFDITLDQPAGEEVTVLVNTQVGTAGLDDFTAIENQLVTFAAGQTTATVTVTVNNETIVEPTESFTVEISDPKFNGATDLTRITIGDYTAVGTITNDDSATISISDATIDEDAGTATFYVSVDHEFGQLFSIDYETADSSATVSNGDYLANSGTLVFFGNANETLAITVLINNDQSSETTENFFVNLSGLSIISPNLTLSDAQAEATINDDDAASFTIDDVTVNEADGTAVFTVTLNKDINSGVSVDWSTADSTATNAVDYSTDSGTLNFTGTAGETQTISVTLLQDSDIESPEQFFVNLSNVQDAGQNVLIADNQGIATITDDDSGSLSINDITVNEGDGTAEFTVTLTENVGESVSVNWSTADNTADKASDYVASSGTLTFAGNANETQTIVVNLRSDGILETVESFYVNLSNATAANRTVTISDAQGEATISANAEEFSINDITIQEGNGTGTKTMTFTVTRNGADLTSLATIDFRTLTDPADLGGGDFVEVSTPVTLTFAAAAVGVTTQTQTVTVTINKDDSLEIDEEFVVQIENASSGTIVKSQGTGTIVNDDLATLTFSGSVVYPGHAPLEYGEHYGNAYVIVTLDKDITGGLKVDWSTEDIDALDGLDYTADSGTLTFAGNAGETQTITIALLNDVYVEEDETFAVNFSNLAINDPLLDPEVKEELLKSISLPEERAVIEILNDEGEPNPTISFVSYKIGYEGLSSSIELNAKLNQAVLNGASFQYTVVDGTASAAENDYTPQTGIITFQGNANELQPITIQINDDTIAELDETFYIELTQLTGASLPIDLSNAYAIIVDNDTPSVTVSVDDITIDEDDELATFTVSLSEATVVDLSMLVNTGDPGDTADVTDYFNLTDYQITIPAGQTSVTIDVPVYRDLLVEEDETFTLTLSDLLADGGTATGWATFSDDTAVATIANVETTGLSVSDVEVDEDASTATFTVSLDTAASEDITFNASTLAGTATGGVDYTELTNQPYTITAGLSSIDITVNITDDSAFESDETFSLVLSSILVGGVADDRLTILKDTGVATIHDDEAANISIADITVNEDGTNAVLTVTVDQIVGYSFTVDWATQGETAQGESDYDTMSGTLTFTGLTANETQQITIPITDDDIVEWDETFLVNLSNVTAAGANVVLSDAQAQVTITGNNDIATLSIGDLTALEHNLFGFEITLDKAATQDITVLVNTADGTADSSDYTALTDYLVTIAAGTTSAFVYVDVIDDDLIEGSETFTVSLSGELIDGATDATRVAIGAGALGMATGTISNNDFSDPSTTANATDDFYFIKVEDLENTVELDVLLNDTKSGSTTITSITAATGGGVASVGQTAGDDVIVFTPDSFASGTITFNYTFEDSVQSTGTGQVTIVIIDPYGIYGDFKNDRYTPGIEAPSLGKVPEYISQVGATDDYLTKFESPSLIDDVETVNILDTVTYQNAMGTGGSYSVTTDIDSTLTRDYTDNGGGSWTYSEDLTTTYTITTTFSDVIGVSEFNTLDLIQSGSHNYQYDITRTVPGTGNATTTWTLSENASDHYEIDADMTIEEPGDDDYTTVVTTTTLDSTYNYGDQSYTLSASENREDDGQGGDILIGETHDLAVFQKDEYKEEIISVATIAVGAGQIGISTVTVNTDGVSQWTRGSDRDYDYFQANGEHTTSESFSYTSSGHDHYSSVETTNILGTINETEDITVSEETTDINGTVTPAVVLSTTFSTYSNIDIDTTDVSHDEFSLNYTGTKSFDNVGSNTVDTESTTYAYSDSGYADYSTDEYSEIDINTDNAHGDQRFYTLEDVVENSHSEYATTTSNTSRFGNTSGAAHSEYTSSGWSDYDIYGQTIIEDTDESEFGVIDVYNSNEIVDNYGSDSYRAIEVLDEQLVSSNLEGTSSYLSASNGIDHHSLASTTSTSNTDTSVPGSTLILTSLVETTDQGTTNWGSSYSNKGNYQVYNYINPISAPGLINHSYNIESYSDGSSGNKTTTLHTRDTFSYNEGVSVINSSVDDYNESNRSYDFVDSSSGFSEYTTDEESLDATGDQRKSTIIVDQEDQYSYSESNGTSTYVIDQDSSQFVDTVVDGITTQLTASDRYDESGTTIWSSNDGGISTYTGIDISTTVDAGENWTEDEVNSISETASHDWTQFNESGSNIFDQHSELDKITIDESIAGTKNTIHITTLYDEQSGTVIPEEGVDAISNTSFSSSVRSDDYLYADGTTSNVIQFETKEKSASTYSLSESDSYEILITANPRVTSEQRGTFTHTRDNGERSSQVSSSEITTTTGTPLPEGTPDSDPSDRLVSAYDLDEMHYITVGQISNNELTTDRSDFMINETNSTVDITVEYPTQTVPDSEAITDRVIARSGVADTQAGIAAYANSGGYGGDGNSFTFGDGLNVPPDLFDPTGSSFYRISLFDSNSQTDGNEFKIKSEAQNIDFLGELGLESTLLIEVTEDRELTTSDYNYTTLDASRITPVLNAGSSSNASQLPSYQVASSEYSENINGEPGTSHTTTTFLSLSSVEDTNGDVTLESINRITASTNQEWDLLERSETAAGNNGTNARNHSWGDSTYDGTHQEIVNSVTDPNQTDEFLTTTVVTDNFVTHAEDHTDNELRFGGANQISSGWSIDLHFIEESKHIVDTEVDVVITTDVNDVTTEVGTRHTFHDNILDHSSYGLIVKGDFGSNGVFGSFYLTADGGTTSVSTEDITMTDAVITDRTITEDLSVSSGYRFSMSAKGNGFEFSTTAGGGNGMIQNKRGNLEFEVIEGIRTNYSSYSSRAEFTGWDTSTSSGGSSDVTRYRMVRYFDPNHNTGDFVISNYHQSKQSRSDWFEGQHGWGQHDESSSTTHITGTNGLGEEVAGPGKKLITTTDSLSYAIDPDGNPSGVAGSEGALSSETFDNDDADQFANFLPTLPFFDPMSFVNNAVNGVGFFVGGLNFLDNGNTATAPTPTGPPVETGTEPDGTYWELYDNGDAWIKRTYVEKDGELIKEEWGYHTQTFHELLKGFNQLIEDAGKNTALESIDEFFADLTKVEESLSRTNNSPKLEEKLKNYKRIITNLLDRLQNEDLSAKDRNYITRRIMQLAGKYARRGGDLTKLGLDEITHSQDSSNPKINSSAFDRVVLHLLGVKHHQDHSTFADRSYPQHSITNDFLNILPHFMDGITSGIISDVASLPALGVEMFSMYDPTHGYASGKMIKLFESLGITVPKGQIAQQSELVTKFLTLGIQLIKESIFGSPSTTQEIYDQLIQTANEDFNLKKDDLLAIIEFLKIAAEELRNFPQWTDAEKAHLLGQLTYEVISGLVPGGAFAKAAKGSKLAQLLAKTSRSKKIEKLRTNIGPNTKADKLLDEILEDLSSNAGSKRGDIPLTKEFKEINEATEAGVRIEWDTPTSRNRLYMNNRVDPKNAKSFEREIAEDRANALFGFDESGRPTIFLRKDATRIEFLEEKDHFNEFKKWAKDRSESGVDLGKAWRDHINQRGNKELIEMHASKEILKWLDKNGGTTVEKRVVGNLLSFWETLHARKMRKNQQ